MNQIMEIFTSRRSIRHYRQEDVADSALHDILIMNRVRLSGKPKTILSTKINTEYV